MNDIFDIKKTIIDKYDLTLNKITLLEYIHFYSISIDGFSFITNEKLMRDLPLIFKNNRTLTRYIRQLEEVGVLKVNEDPKLKYKFIERFYKKDIKDSYYGIRCEWCNSDVLTTDRHHYPIPKCENGRDTVQICPTCHMTFHHLWALQVKLPDIINEGYVPSLSIVK